MPQATAELQRALDQLVGQPLRRVERDADLLEIHFGVSPGAPPADGGEPGELVLRVACPWRLVDAERILVGSGDLFTPADPDEEPATFDWETPGASWLDVRLRELADRHAGAFLVVTAATADAFGGARLALDGGLAVELFANSTPTGHVATEFWRLARPAGGEADWVVGTFGVEREEPE